MSNSKAGISAVLDAASVISREFSDKTDIGAAVISNSSLGDARTSIASGQKVEMDSRVDIMLADISNDSALPQPTQAQIEAVKYAAAISTNPTALTSMQGYTAAPSADRVITSDDLGLGGTVARSEVTNMAFDPSKVDTFMEMNIASAYSASRQGPLVEALFPTITVAPDAPGIAVSADISSFHEEFSADATGDPKDLFRRVTLAKAAYDDRITGDVRNAVVAVLRDESSANLVPALQHTVTVNGEDVITAPYRAGRDINVLSISQSAATLALGGIDSTETLDRGGVLSEVFFNLDATIAGVATTETFRINTAGMRGSNFKYSVDGHEKDLTLSFDSSDVYLTTGVSTTSNNTTSVILGEVAANHKLRYRVRLHGGGNVMSGLLGVYATTLELVSIEDGAGDLLVATSAAYIAIADVVGTISLLGWNAKLNTTNSNNRIMGPLATSDTYTVLYDIPILTGVTVQFPVGQPVTKSILSTQVNYAGLRANRAGIKTLIAKAEELDYVKSNGGDVANIATRGIGSYYTDPYFEAVSIDLDTVLDSKSSRSRRDDIKATIGNFIKEEILRQWTESNLNVAFGQLHGEGPAGFVVGLGGHLASYVGDIDMGDGFAVKVIAENDPALGNNIYVAPSNWNKSDRNTVVDPISFGATGFANTVLFETKRSVGNGQVGVLMTHPRHLHFTNIDILSVLTVTNLDKALGKVVGLRKTVA